MVTYTQTIRQQQPTNCLSVFDHFVRLALKDLSLNQRKVNPGQIKFSLISRWMDAVIEWNGHTRF